MRNCGFTLIEVLVATVVAAMVAMIAAALFGTAADAVETSVTKSISMTREANARRWVQDAVTGMVVANKPEARFEGGPTSVEFQTSYRVGAGWVEDGRISLEYDGHRLVGLLPDVEAVVLADSVRAAAFDYRLTVGGPTTWLTQWRSGATLPVALRIRLGRPSGAEDTLVFYIGARG